VTENLRLSSKGAARRAGVVLRVWYNYTRQGRTPQPDGYLIDGVDDDGTLIRGLPYWHPSTIDEWQANRPGPGNWARGENRPPGSIRSRREA